MMDWASWGALALVLSLGCCAAAEAPPRDKYVIPDTEALLRLLDFQRPELAPVKAALDRGDVAGAGRAYAAYFRQKPVASPLLTDWRTTSRNPAATFAAADKTLAGRLHDGYSSYEVPPTGLDWRESPLSCVTRFPLVGPVRWAYHHTRSAKYARWMADHMLGFIKTWPTSEYLGHNSKEGWTSHTVVARPWYWCMLPERMAELAESLNLLRDCPEVTDEELLSLVRRLLEEAGYCRQEIKLWVVDLRHNGGCAMIESQAMACTLLDDFLPAREYLAQDGEMAASYLDRAFYPDGMCVELTTAYSLGTSATAQRFAYALRDTPAMAAARDRVTALVTCLVGLSEPGANMPSFGDLYSSGLGHGVFGPVVDWLNLPWARTLVSGKDGPLPPFTVWPQPGQEQWCGYYTMRSDWGKGARYLAIDGGPWGTTHQHGDRLSFVLTAHGARFVIDPSSTRYASNEPGAFISRQIAGFLHNTLTVDGVDEFHETPSFAEAKEPLRNTWEHGEHYSLFAGKYSFRPVKPVDWERRVVFADQAYWLLQDVLTGEQPEAAVEQNFQFEADIKIEFQGNRTVATAPNGAKLLLVPLTGDLKPVLTVGDKEPRATYWPDGKPKLVQCAEDGVEQKHGRGWTGRSGDRLLPAPAVTYVGKVALPATITVAMIPLRADQSLAEMPAITSEKRAETTVWTLPGAGGGVKLEAGLTACRVVKD